MFNVDFGGYHVTRETLRQAQMVLAQARREMRDGDVDAWFYAGCPVGRAYKKWADGR